MKQQYQIWIDNYKEKHKIIAGLCFPACSLMLQNFPELQLIRGYIIDIWDKKRTHWWLKTESGEIIDPTVSQFDNLLTFGSLVYEEYNEFIHGPLATGKCMNCGECVYNDEQFCNVECEKNTFKYLNEKRNVL